MSLDYKFNYFINFSHLSATYISSDINGVEGKKLEFVPALNCKTGFQLGYKAFDFFYIPRLTMQMEYNFVRPYTYAHHNPQQNYGHYNQPLAHPLGANFSELLLMTNYKWKRFSK